MAKKNNNKSSKAENVATNCTNTAYEASKAKQNYKSKLGETNCVGTNCNATDCHTTNCK